jgi:hypothetical protein
MTDADKANAVITDGELERGEHPIGQYVHISTVTHAWRGWLLAVTPSYFVLDHTRAYALVDSTGPMGDYAVTPTTVREGDEVAPSKGKGKGKGTAPAVPRIPRGAVAWLLSWPE